MLQSFIHVTLASNPISSSGRAAALVAIVLGLTGAIIGVRGLARTADRRRSATVALVMSPIGMILGALVSITAPGGLGTGNGYGGGIVAVVVGTVGLALGALGRARHAERS